MVPERYIGEMEDRKILEVWVILIGDLGHLLKEEYYV